MLRFPRLIPSPFYTGWCLYIEAGTLPVARFPAWCHGHRYWFYRRITVSWMATAADIRRTIENQRRAVNDRDQREPCLQNFTLCVRVTGHTSLPLIICVQPLAFWYSTCKSGFPAIESPPSRPRSSQLTSDSCVCLCIRSKNSLPAQSLTAHLRI